MIAVEESLKKRNEQRQGYSVSFIAAISQHKVISSQVIEGGVDSVVFENYIYQTLWSLRQDPLTLHKEIILFLDNAVIHRHASVMETTTKFKVNVLFNAEYSPWLNPIERLFGVLKRSIRSNPDSFISKYVCMVTY